MSTKGQPHTTIEGAGHFLQEDKGEDLAKVSLEWFTELGLDRGLVMPPYWVVISR